MARTLANQHGTDRLIAGWAAKGGGGDEHRNAAELVRCSISAGQHREHAGCRCCRCRLDALQACMGMRRAQHIAIGLARQVVVADIAPAAGEKARILAAPDRLADAEFGHVVAPLPSGVKDRADHKIEQVQLTNDANRRQRRALPRQTLACYGGALCGTPDPRSAVWLRQKQPTLPDPPGLRERNKRAKLEKISRAARSLFIRRGYDATTLRHIAAKAGVGLGTLFSYAADKRDLLFLIINDDIEAMNRRALAAAPADRSLLERVVARIR